MPDDSSSSLRLVQQVLHIMKTRRNARKPIQNAHMHALCGPASNTSSTRRSQYFQLTCELSTKQGKNCTPLGWGDGQPRPKRGTSYTSMAQIDVCPHGIFPHETVTRANFSSSRKIGIKP